VTSFRARLCDKTIRAASIRHTINAGAFREEGWLKELWGVQVDRDALMQLIFPEGSSEFLQLSWVVVIFAALLFAVLFEISLLAIKIFNSDDGSSGGPGTNSMASMSSVDLEEEEVRFVRTD
jgi:hypothetical protein